MCGCPLVSTRRIKTVSKKKANETTLTTHPKSTKNNYWLKTAQRFRKSSSFYSVLFLFIFVYYVWVVNTKILNYLYPSAFLVSRLDLFVKQQIDFVDQDFGYLYRSRRQCFYILFCTLRWWCFIFVHIIMTVYRLYAYMHAMTIRIRTRVLIYGDIFKV